MTLLTTGVGKMIGLCDGQDGGQFVVVGRMNVVIDTVAGQLHLQTMYSQCNLYVVTRQRHVIIWLDYFQGYDVITNVYMIFS